MDLNGSASATNASFLITNVILSEGMISTTQLAPTNAGFLTTNVILSEA